MSAQVTEQWKKGTVDRTCATMADPEHVKLKAALEPCVTRADCKAFADCFVPAMEAYKFANFKAAPPTKGP